MNQRQQSKDIDKAISHVMRFGKQSPWVDRYQELSDEILKKVAYKLKISFNELMSTLEDGGIMDMIIPYLYELFITCTWDNEDKCLIEEYIQRRGWREPPYAKRYLHALAQSEVQLWEVITVNPGHWVEIRLLQEQSKAIRVFEKNGSKNLTRWDCIAARVLTLDGRNIFSGGILPFSPDISKSVSILLEGVRQDTVQTLTKFYLKEKSEKLSAQDIENIADQEVHEQFPDLLLTLFASNAYLALTSPMQTLVNGDGHELSSSKVKFPIETRHKKNIENIFRDSLHLDFDENSNIWIWHELEENSIQNFGATILGDIALTDNFLIATVNSVERSLSIENFIVTLLGDLIGKPLAIHESIESISNEPSDADHFNLDTCEDPELLTQFLNQHYRSVLDEPVPMLNNLTPRECSADQSQRHILLQWLKELENGTLSNPSMSHYSFQWFWDELGVER